MDKLTVVLMSIKRLDKMERPLAGFQIPFKGTRLGFVQVSIMEGSLLLS